MGSPSPASGTSTDNVPLSELERLRIALSIDDTIVYDWSLVDDTIVWDDKALSILQMESLESLSTGAKFKSFLDTDGIALRDDLEKNPLADLTPFQIEYQFRASAEEPCWLEDRGIRLLDDNGHLVRVVGILRVVTDRKTREARFKYLASYDELTGHLNRARLRERLGHAIERVASQGGSGGYFVVGIDDLAVINADYGFDVADEVIAQIGERLRCVIAETGKIGRTAGNKFGIIVADCVKKEMLSLAHSLVDEIHNIVIETSGGPVSASVSVGYVEFPKSACDSQEAMSRAEEALDRAKRSGRGHIEAFRISSEVESGRRRNAIIADRIVSALNDRRICMAFQPIVSAHTKKVHQYEALIRMVSKDGEIEIAGNFVPQAEQLGLIRLIDRRALELVIEVLYKNTDLHIAVNVSGITATESLCVEGYLAQIEANRSVANRMTVELTETSALRNIEESAHFVSRLRGLGCKVAIDDFGAGYTSFRNLQELVVDCVKIDGSFIRGLAEDKDNQLFVRTLVDLARNFGLETVAECVGTRQEAELLRGYGVDYLQGFYFGEPMIQLEAGLSAPNDIIEKIA